MHRRELVTFAALDTLSIYHIKNGNNVFPLKDDLFR